MRLHAGHAVSVWLGLWVNWWFASDAGIPQGTPSVYLSSEATTNVSTVLSDNGISNLQVFGYRSPSSPSGWNITPERQQLISSLMTLGAFISSGTAGFVAATLGRKMCLWLACLLCVASDVIMMATTDIGALYAGRFLIGLANGYFMTFSQLYIQESSPAKYRGLFLAVFQFCTSMVGQTPSVTPPLRRQSC